MPDGLELIGNKGDSNILLLSFFVFPFDNCAVLFAVLSKDGFCFDKRTGRVKIRAQTYARCVCW